MKRLRILQIFFNSALLIAIVVLAADSAVRSQGRFSERIVSDIGGILFLIPIVALLFGSIIPNARLVADTAFTFKPPSRLFPALTLLAGSITVLYLMIIQGFGINVEFDAHLSRYDLIFLLPDALQSDKQFWLDSGISISGDGTQIVVFFICLMTINLLATMYNAGLISQEYSVDAKYLTTALIVSQIAVGVMVGLWAVVGITMFYGELQSFIRQLDLDPAMMNSSNLAQLAYLFICYTFLGLYAQWILRDGLKLRRIMRKSQHAADDETR